MKSNRLDRIFPLVLLLLAVSIPVSAGTVEKLKDDPRILRGTTGNGMSYYIVKNAAKKGYADFYLVQKGGMAVEDTSEAGITRFLQEMSLRGTRNFPDGDIIKYLRRIGVVYDRGIKLETYENGCVTGMADVPVGRIPSSADSCLLILYNWSYSINLDDEDVEREKVSRTERLKVTDSPERRIAEKSYGAAFAGGAFARQNMDRQIEDLQHFTPKHLRNYYYKWFTPEKQAIVVSGDIDQSKIETYIKTLFSTVPKPAMTVGLHYAVIPPKDTVQFIILSDPGLKHSQVSLTMQTGVLNDALRLTGVALIEDYMNTLCCSIFRKRLEESAMSAGFPVYGIDVEYGPYFVSPMADSAVTRITSNREALTIKVNTDEKHIYDALDFIVREAERVDRYGFSNPEYELANSEYWRMLNREYYSRVSSSTNAYYSNMCISNFLNGRSLASVELRHLYMSKINVPDTLYSSQINSYTRLLDNPERDALVIISTPSEQDYFDHDHLLGTYVTALASPCDSLKDAHGDSTIFKLDLSSRRKEIAKESREKITGAVVWTLPNGATVVCKNSDTTQGRFIFNAFGKGGVSLAKDTAAKWTTELGTIAGFCRICGYDSFELDRMMAGRDMSLSSGINDYSEFLSGEGSSESLEDFLRFVYMCFTSRAPDTLAFRAYLRDHGSKMTMDDYYACFDYISGRFRNASNFTFIFTGDIDVEKLKEFCGTYIATLPADGARNNWERGKINNAETDRIGRIVYKTPMDYGKENYLLFNVARDIIDRYLCARFGESGMLVRASGDLYFYPSGYALLKVDYKASGSDDGTRREITDALDSLAKNGVDPDDFKNVVSSLSSNPEISVRDNDYWMKILYGRYLVGKNLFPYYEEQMTKLTKPAVDVFIRQLLTEDDAE
ncbi:MAG: insulinase family protein [Bacteroidales bacterium]|jgi:zinc protease|nr:insulinase family protein [Bacteroidales bacterium]MCI2121105.1 insulinase family protein [Bacteroidales bacterium]MCI2144920.1 insulinase family protein [Bacteroidales bacterium]